MRYHCTTCAGKGVFVALPDGSCPSCKGSGKHPVRAGRPCVVCKGSKRIEGLVSCPDCVGQGYTD